MMRILFYLPAITPWWFENIIAPLLERLALDNEVHILAPVLWQGTGVGQSQYDLCAHMPQICWHVVTDDDHISMRTSARQSRAIIDFVRSIDPHFVLCRSADFQTVAQFPGTVRHITEGGAEPLSLPATAVHFTKVPFAHGLLPALSESRIAQLDALIEPYWEPLLNAPCAQLQAQNAFRDWAQLPCDKAILSLPLEYEHEENFYTLHRSGPVPNARMVRELLDELDPRVFLAITNHPLNELYVDNSELELLVATYPDRMALLPGETPYGERSTHLLMRASNGVLLGDSKAFSLAGFCGTPVLRRSQFASGEWLHAYEDLGKFSEALIKGSATPPNIDMARIWFAYHAANNLIYPQDPALTGKDLLSRLITPFDPSRWERNLGVFAVDWEKAEQVLT